MREIENLNNILEKAHLGGYAVGSFSPRYSKLIKPILEAAIEENSPVIIQISEKEINRHKVTLKEFTDEFFRIFGELNVTVPVALHLDHTKTIDVIKDAISVGFTSVMIDASEYDFNKNLEITKEVVTYAKKFDVSVEAELGKIGTTDFVETDKDEEMFTVPREAKIFCDESNVDCLAVSVGTAHGIYTVRQPKIDFARLEEINKLINTPLVLHGGSGVPSSLVVEAAKMNTGGVSKVNIATDLEQEMLKVVGRETHLTEQELNEMSSDLIEKSRLAVKLLVKDKMKNYLLSSNRV